MKDATSIQTATAVTSGNCPIKRSEVDSKRQDLSKTVGKHLCSYFLSIAAPEQLEEIKVNVQYLTDDSTHILVITPSPTLVSATTTFVRNLKANNAESNFSPGKIIIEAKSLDELVKTVNSVLEDKYHITQKDMDTHIIKADFTPSSQGRH